MKNRIPFTKMHGLGNDFVVINNLKQTFKPTNEIILQWADRYRGIGFDQLLLIEPAPQADFSCRIFNADGSEAEQCGNGLRCVARFIIEEQLRDNNSLTVQTKAGIYPITVFDFDHVTVTMGAPHIQEKSFVVDLKKFGLNNSISILSIGNPHAIIKVNEVDLISAKEIAATIASHSYFSNGANVGFMQITDPQHIYLRTFERGVGETLSCGSNACAAVVAGVINGWLNSSVEVKFKHGSLFVDWKNHDKFIQLTGPATRSFNGEIVFES